MGVYIKGMEMPKDGAFIEVMIWSDGHVTKTGDSYLSEDGKHYYKPCDFEYFSAITVPDHGDLIDRRELLKTIVKRLGIRSREHFTHQESFVCAIIDDAPTVIPATRRNEHETFD